MLFLHVYDGDLKLQELKLKDGRDGKESIVTIGRDPKCILMLADLSVSRIHCQVEPQGNYFHLRDLGSTNGTFVNDRAIKLEIINSGDVIRIGKYVLKVESRRKNRPDTSKIKLQSVVASVPRDSATPITTVLLHAGVSSEKAMANETRDQFLQLYKIQQELGHIDTLPSLLDRSLERLLVELKADCGCILLVDFLKKREVESPDDLVPSSVAYRHGDSESENEVVVPLEAIKMVLEKKTAVMVEASTGPDFMSLPALSAPFLQKNRVLGMVYLQRRNPSRAFHQDDLEFLTLLASMAAVNIANARLFEEIHVEKEKLQAVITSLSDGVLVTDSSFRIVEASSSAALLLEQTENLIDKPFFETVRNFTLTMEPALIRSEVERGGSFFEMERSTASGRTLSVRILPFSGNVSGMQGRIITLRDATEARKLEQLKTSFIGTIAHKLRTPLTIIEGNLPLLHAGIPPETPENEILKDIEKSSQSLCELVNDFVEFMEMEITSRRSLSMEERVPLRDLAWQAIRFVKDEAAKRKILIVDKLPSELPSLKVNRQHFVQAIVHILENAVKFSPDGGIVTLEGEGSPEAVRLHVTDEGPGIPAAAQKWVCLLFHQIDEQKTGNVPGLGLGLAIALQVAREHGGDIQITSPYRFADHGCRITLVVPIGSTETRNGAGDRKKTTAAGRPGAEKTTAKSLEKTRAGA